MTITPSLPRAVAMTATVPLLLAGTFASSGCGDDESPATSDKKEQVAAEQGGPRGPDDVPPPALLPVADRLEDAGYRFSTIEKETPEQIELVVCDRRIYLAVTEAPKEVDSARFRKIVEIGEAS